MAPPQLPGINMASEKAIVCVHGAGPKPPREQLLTFWRDAIVQGLQRGHPQAVQNFETAHFQMLYWADEVGVDHHDYDLALDLQQRQQVLERLGQLQKTREFRRRHYDALPGKTALKEFLMDSAAMAGLGGLIWPRVMPELAAYWQDSNSWAANIRARLNRVVTEHLDQGREVVLISHCMGAVISYDALCELNTEHRLSRWLTLGSPLSSNAIRNRLLQAPTGSDAHYPPNILEWHNLAAEDDYVCHDKTVANDFSAMLDRRLIGDIRDYTIYNLAVRYGRSNPHHSSGYLTHPRTAELLAEWLTRDRATECD